MGNFFKIDLVPYKFDVNRSNTALEVLRFRYGGW